MIYILVIIFNSIFYFIFFIFDNISLSVNEISNKHKKEQHLLKSKKINFKSLNIVNKKEK